MAGQHFNLAELGIDPEDCDEGVRIVRHHERGWAYIVDPDIIGPPREFASVHLELLHKAARIYAKQHGRQEADVLTEMLHNLDIFSTSTERQADGGAVKQFDLEALGIDQAAFREAIRVLVSSENVIIIDPEVIREPFALGLLCMDIMKHGALAFSSSQGIEIEEAFKTILAGFMAELQNPTDQAGEPN